MKSGEIITNLDTRICDCSSSNLSELELPCLALVDLNSRVHS